MPLSEIRKDYIQDKYVIIAARRGKRPHEIDKKSLPANTCRFYHAQLDKEPYVMEVCGFQDSPFKR